MAGVCKHCGRKASRGLQCNTCVSRLKRQRNPIRYAYDTLRPNVTRKKGAHFFELTFDEFREFCIAFDYVGKKGITTTGYGIDCKDPTMGYFVGNIRPLSNAANTRKRRKFLNYEWDPQERRMVAFLTDNEPTVTDGPF